MKETNGLSWSTPVLEERDVEENTELGGAATDDGLTFAS